MQAKLAVSLVLEAARKGELKSAFSSNSNEWGEWGIDVDADGRIHITQFEAYVRGGRLPRYSEWTGSEKELVQAVRVDPYFFRGGAIKQLVKNGHIVGHSFE